MRNVVRAWLLGLVTIGLPAGCAPYRPPPETPALTQARGPLRLVVPKVSELSMLVVRAGSAYDPPGREGLARVVAEGLAARVGVHVHVGPELVYFPGGEHVAELAAALAAPMDEAALAAGLAAAPGALPRTCADHAAQAVDAWAFAGHPYGHAAVGRTSVRPTFTAGELEAFRLARYVRDAAVVVGSEAGTAPLREVLPPRLSRSPTPAVWNRAPRAALQVTAPVEGPCTGFGAAGFTDWSAADEASYRVLARLAGNPPPELTVQPVVRLVVPGAVATPPVGGDVGTARAWVAHTLDLAPVTGLDEAARTLLGAVRGAQVPAAADVRAALAGVDEASLHAWVARRFAGAVRVDVVPAATESPAPPGVLSFEALVR